MLALVAVLERCSDSSYNGEAAAISESGGVHSTLPQGGGITTTNPMTQANMSTPGQDAFTEDEACLKAKHSAASAETIEQRELAKLKIQSLCK